MAAYADLGGLGTKQGPSVALFWPMPNLAPLLLPWLVVLALLALPSNRDPRAWWIWAPLIGLVLVGAGLETVADAANNEALSALVQAACATAFGLTTVWLLGAALARRGLALGIPLAALAFAAVSLLAFLVSPASELVADLRQWEPAILLYLGLFWISGGVVFAGALILTGRLCRSRPGRARISLWLPLWLWAMWLAAAGLVSGVTKLVSGDSIEWNALLVAPIILALVSFVTMLPFLILSFTNAFYRERLQQLLRLPPTAPAPLVPMPVPTPAPEAAKP